MTKFLDSTFNFIKKNGIIFTIVIIYILLYSLFENVITIGLVEPIFSHIKSNLTNDIVCVLCIVPIILRCSIYIWRNYTISNKYILISFIILIYIAYYRLTSNPWEFTSLQSLSELKYIDILFAFFASNILIKLFHRKRIYKYDNSQGFNFDNPIEKEDEDLLKRNNTAKQIANRIKNTVNDETSFAIGINGKWGQGKTSFINLISRNLIENNRIIVKFNPWLNNDEKSIIYSFFDELSLKLRTYNKELSNNILKYATLLNSIGTDSVSKFSDLFSTIQNDKSVDLKGRFDNINEEIKKSGFQFVIFIDDLDRLFENEILEVLKLIRNSASFSNTVFVASYDRNYLISALEKVNSYHPDFYLEKIFQIEFSLPAFDKVVIKDKLKKIIKPHLLDKDKIKFDELISKNFFSLFGGNYFNIELLSNLRDVNRFSNSFIISYQSLKGEIDLTDLLNIELLRIKYLGVYNLLSTEYNKFLEAYTFQATNNFLTLKREKNHDGNDTDKVIIKEYLKDNYKDVGIQSVQIDDVINYLYCVFPHYDYLHDLNISLLSISNPISINRYFHYDLLDSNLSEIEFSNFRRKNTQEFKEQIKKWVEKELQSEVAIRLENIELFESKEDYEKVIESIFYFASLPNSSNAKYRRDYIGFNSNNLYYKLFFNKVSNLYQTEQEFRIFVKRIFEQQPSPFILISDFINIIFEKTGLSQWDFILSKEDLKSYKIHFFELYSKSIDKIDIYFFWLRSFCDYSDWVSSGGNSYTKKEREQEEAKNIFIACASRLPASFIKNVISKASYFPQEKDPLQYSILKTILKVWESWDKFEEFINNMNEKEIQGLKEFKEFYQKCKENDFNYIEYTFNEIDLSDALLLSN